MDHGQKHIRSSFSENNHDHDYFNYRLSKEFKFNKDQDQEQEQDKKPTNKSKNTDIQKELYEAFHLNLEKEDNTQTTHDEEMSMTDKAIVDYHQHSTFFKKFILRFITNMHHFESIVNTILLIILIIFIICSLISVFYQTYLMFKNDPHFIFGQSQYPTWLDGVFFVLIGVELSKSIIAQLGHDKSYIEVIVLVAITAVARSIVIQEYKGTYDSVFGMALLMLALGICILLLKLSNKK